MKVLFLDIDGVLNSTQHFVRVVREHGADWAPGPLEFCPMAVSNLLHVLEKSPDTQIVVSSSWRIGRSVDELRAILGAVGIPPERVLDKTAATSFNRNRGRECAEWLEHHPQVQRFAIVDDDADFSGRTKKQLVRTNPNHGLMFDDARELLTLLNGKCAACQGRGRPRDSPTPWSVCTECRGYGYKSATQTAEQPEHCPLP